LQVKHFEGNREREVASAELEKQGIIKVPLATKPTLTT
jgi:hypothetical protein